MADNSVEVGLEFPTVYEAHGIHSHTSANEKNMNDVGTMVRPTPVSIFPVIPVESIRAISERFVNTAYGFFLGKRMAYPVVANYVRNTWGKYGLVKLCFKNGPWFIRKHLLILKKWNPDVNLLKEDVGNVSVWVKLHGVPVTAFSEDGLSAIAMKLGTPLMLDSYTSDMCLLSWGRSSYARAMVELRADVELKDTIVVAMPKLTGEGFYTDECPKNIGAGETKNLKKPSQTPRGVPVGQKVPIEGRQIWPAKRPILVDLQFWNVNSPSTTPIIKKIDKIEKLIIDGKVTLVDNEGKPLEKVESSGDYDSKDEVASVDNEMASFFARKDGYGTDDIK
ncbi:putative reverse transcriptase domain-containing protein [Tanacetum coccineum]